MLIGCHPTSPADTWRFLKSSFALNDGCGHRGRWNWPGNEDFCSTLKSGSETLVLSELFLGGFGFLCITLFVRLFVCLCCYVACVRGLFHCCCFLLMFAVYLCGVRVFIYLFYLLIWLCISFLIHCCCLYYMNVSLFIDVFIDWFIYVRVFNLVMHQWISLLIVSL